MAFQGSDHLAISRAGTLYKVTGQDVLAYIQQNVGTSEYEVADIAARNALTGLSTGDRIFVVDATTDATVSSGWAIYVYRSPGVFTKVAEQEGLDLVIGGTNLTYTPGANSGIVVSSSGTDATIPAVSTTEAGLMLPAHKTKVDFLTVSAAIDLDAVRVKTGYLTVTAATDLDAIRSNSHAPVTTAGTATSNPITVTGQQLNFSIANLSTAP